MARVSDTHLLPPNATKLERNAACACAEIERVPIPLRDLWNPWTCPAELLPYLAWARSVDRWDSSWSEETKRAVTAAAFVVHRRKGTIGALRRAIWPIGRLNRVVEWWQQTPPGIRGTFSVDVGVLDSGITEEMYAELERLIDDAKPVSRHLVGLAISVETAGAAYLGAGVFLGDELTVYAYMPSTITVGGALYDGAAVHTVETTTVYP